MIPASFQANAPDTYDWAGLRVRDLLCGHSPGTTVLDIGPGWGKYSLLLRPALPLIDAVEVFEPYIEHCGLRALYREVYVADVCEWVETPQFQPYAVAILGDVLEHIEVSRAQALLATLLATCGQVIVVIPYLYLQGAEHGNEHQRHLQDDLTPELAAARYPGLRLLDTEYRGGAPYKGLYCS